MRILSIALMALFAVVIANAEETSSKTVSTPATAQVKPVSADNRAQMEANRAELKKEMESKRAEFKKEMEAKKTLKREEALEHINKRLADLDQMEKRLSERRAKLTELKAKVEAAVAKSDVEVPGDIAFGPRPALRNVPAGAPVAPAVQQK